MAIRGIKRFKVSTGEIYLDEKDAIKSQKSINKANLASFSSEAWEEHIETKAKDKSSVWYGIINDKYGIEDFESVFAELFLGDGENRAELIKLLTEIVHEESRLKML